MQEKETKKKRSKVGLVIFLIVLLVIMGGTYYFSHNYLVVFPISGESMKATLNDGDKVIIFKTKKVKYDDIFIFYAPELEGGKYLVKRVIGLAGDKIEIKYSENDSLYHVYRNGEILSESHIFEPMDRNYQEISLTVPEGKVFFLGDNRLNSLDSHSTSDSNHRLLADVNQIQGIVFVRYTSWKDIKFLLS